MEQAERDFSRTKQHNLFFVIKGNMNISKTIDAKIKIGEEEEVEVFVPEHVHYPPIRLNKEETEERGWVVPTRFNSKGVKVTSLKVCTKKWTIKEVEFQFQHWPTTWGTVEIKEFARHNGGELLALLDREGIPEIFYESEKWCVDTAWETLHTATKHDLGRALATDMVHVDTVYIEIKKRIKDLEKLNAETPGTTLAFSVLRGMRNECSDYIRVKERAGVGNLNAKMIEIGAKYEKLADEIPTSVISVCKENGYNVDGTRHEGEAMDNEREAMERLNKF